jgi:hypothetical protein
MAAGTRGDDRATAAPGDVRSARVAGPSGKRSFLDVDSLNDARRLADMRVGQTPTRPAEPRSPAVRPSRHARGADTLSAVR